MNKDVTCISPANTSKRIINDFLFLLQIVEENDHPVHSIEVSEDRVFVQQKHAYWIHEHLPSTSGGSYPVIRCSECKSQFPMWETKYCPDCGAKMDKENRK